MRKPALQIMWKTIRPFSVENLDEVIKSLEKDSIKLFQWFSDNQMKANHDKCHLLVSGKNNVTMNLSGFKIKKH